MKIQSLKRIAEEDFKEEDRDLIRKLAFSLNPALDQLNSALDKNIDFDNLNQSVVSFKVQVDALGIPTIPLQLASPLKSSIQGILCIRVDNLTDGALLTGAPFVNFTRNSGLLTISQITGLQPNKQYNVVVILIG